MLFLKRLILGFAALGFIFLGGSGTQSGSIMAQGGGFVGLVLGIIVLYIFFKMAWRAMGCLPSFIIFSVVVVFILYAIGAFNNGLSGLSSNLKNFAGQNNVQEAGQEDALIMGPDLLDGAPVEEEDIIPSIDEELIEIQEEPAVAPQQSNGQKSAGTLGSLINSLSGQPGNAQPQEPEPFNPANYPAIHGLPKVINGDTIAIQGGYLKLFGIDAPEPNQSCADRQGRSYRCGREAAIWLKSWITGNTIECRIMKRDRKGNMLGICSLGEYDIGAALVNAGWAVADVNTTDIYFPYQDQAKINKRGLWQGKFYMPWDWRVLQTKKPKIKVIKPKKPISKGILDL